MNELLEAKLTIARIKSQLLDLAGALIADHITDKEYAVKGLLDIVEFIEDNDVKVSEIKNGSY